MRFQLVKKSTGLFPATDQDREKVGKLEVGEVFSCKTGDQRNLRHHRKFMVMIQVFFENLPEKYEQHFPTQDDLRYELTKRAGFYSTYKNLKGETEYRAESISFDSMGQERFDKVYDGVLDAGIKWFGFDKEALVEELMEFAN